MTDDKIMKVNIIDRTCSKCNFAIFADHGYSNYTVEGTTFYCGKNAHPNDEFDRFYGEDKRLDYASECSSFSEGDPIDMDCEMENFDSLNQDKKDLYKKRMNYEPRF